MSKAALRLRAKLGVEVQPRISRAERSAPATRIKRLSAEVISEGHLEGAFRVPDTVGDVGVEVLLSAKAVRFSVSFDGPTEGRAQTRINWLLRQLRGKEWPSDVLLRVTWDRNRQQSQARLSDALADSSALQRDGHGVSIADDAFPKTFALDWTVQLAKGRGRSTAPVLEHVLDSLERFYKEVVEGLRPYVPSAPKLAGEDEDARPDPPKSGDTASLEAVSTSPKHGLGPTEGKP